jgi:spore coat polysaccharide biosynthesis predicted glycosyltransferase SpsG
MQKVLLVCDATTSEGTGHVMRQITLGASLVKYELEVELFCHEVPESLVARARDFQLAVSRRKCPQSSKEIVEEILFRKPDFVVIDGYQFHRDIFFQLYSFGIPCLVVDDNGDFSNVPCTFILNQNLHAKSAHYEKNPYSPTLLIGLSWALIRPEVVEQSQDYTLPEIDSILIAIGGSDHLGLSSQIASSLGNDRKIYVASGFFSSVAMTPKEMAFRMASSSVGIIACGTTVWEACLLGLPMVGLVTADNQLDVAASLKKNGVCEIFDCRHSTNFNGIIESVSALMASQTSRELLSSQYKEMIDGFGSVRVAKAIVKALR